MQYSEALLTGKGVQLSEALTTGGLTTVVGLGIVFLVLLILMLVLCLFRLIFYKDPEKAKKTEVPAVAETPVIEVKEEAQDEDELIAILTAAVAASLNTSTYNLQIKSYRRVKDNRPSWNREGIRETISNRF